MTCAGCGFANPEAMRFCGQCGVALQPETTCAACGLENPPGFKFCGGCGASLAADSRTLKRLRAAADRLRLEHGLIFLVRIGLNSGEVVVGSIGDDLRMEYTAQGYVVGLAARAWSRSAIPAGSI